MRPIKNDHFALICYLVLMENGAGLIDKSPDYVEEKKQMLNEGFNAFAYLDIYNMRKVMEWCGIWGITPPHECTEEMKRQEEAFEEVRYLFEPPLKIHHYNDHNEERTDL